SRQSARSGEQPTMSRNAAICSMVLTFHPRQRAASIAGSDRSSVHLSATPRMALLRLRHGSDGMKTTVRLEAFLEMMSAERGASDNTLAAYRRDLEEADAFLAGGLAQAGPKDMRSFLDDIAARGFAPSSQARKLSSLRQFFRFLYAEVLRPDDPTGTLDAPKKQRPLPKTMAEDAVLRLLARAEAETHEAADEPARLSACRLHALVET